MKRRILWIFLAVEAVLCVLFGILQTSFLGIFTAAMAFPFEQLGLLLRTLSLSGGPGNVVAIILYVTISLVPILALVAFARKRKLRPEDGLLALLSAALFAVLYLMTNPAMIGSFFGGAAGTGAAGNGAAGIGIAGPGAAGIGAAGIGVGKAVLGAMVYSVLCGYLVLRVLRLCFDGSTEKLQRYMVILLGLLNVLFVYVVFGAHFSGLLHSLAALRAGNTGNEHLLGLSYAFLALQFVVDALPYVFNIFVVRAALGLLDEMRVDRYSGASVAQSIRLARLCRTALAATVLAGIAFNLLQLIFAGRLLVVNSSVQIPVLSIAFVLAVLLVARFIEENKRLKDDNDMFI